MKKLLVKHKIIDVPYSPAIPAVPEKWTKEDQEVFEQPMVETSPGVFEPDSEWQHHPAIAEVPEIQEFLKDIVIAQTQGSDEELAQWLAGDSFKYPEGYWVEYVDITQEINDKLALQEAELEIAKGIKAIATFKVLVKKKSLNQAQIAQLFSDPEIAKIISTLSTGSLPLAKALISLYPADGVIVTEGDKAEIISVLG